MHLEHRPRATRTRTDVPGGTLDHAFATATHYDPENTGWAELVADDLVTLAPGAGFPVHRHRGTVVHSWVLEGVLRHRDDDGELRVPAGHLLRFDASAGAAHAEDAPDGAVRFLQQHVLAAPSPQERGCVQVGAVQGQSCSRVDGAAAHHVGPGRELLPDAPRRHLTALVDGALTRPGGTDLVVRAAAGGPDVTAPVLTLRAGDTVRVDGSGPLELEGAAVLWTFAATD